MKGEVGDCDGGSTCEVAVDTSDLEDFVKEQMVLEPTYFLKHEEMEGSFLKAMLVPVLYPMVVENSFNGVPNFQRLCGVIPPREEKKFDSVFAKKERSPKVDISSDAEESGDDDHEEDEGEARGENLGRSDAEVKSEEEDVDYAEAWKDPSKPKGLRVYNFILSWLFRLGAWSGSEGFYIFFLPALFWCGSASLGRRCIMYWSLSMYMGQYMKEHFQLPRPFVVSKKVRILGYTHWLAEYGFPSTHVMASVGLGSVYLHYLSKYTVPEELPIPMNFIIAYVVFMAVITSFGRLYLGVHSVPDLIGGLVFHMLLFGLYVNVESDLDHFITTNPSSTWGSALFCVTLMLAFPRLKKFSATFGDTAIVVGCGNGVAMAQYAFSDVYKSLPFTPDDWTIWLRYSLGRTVIGIVVVLMARLVVKTVVRTLVLIICGRNSKTPVNQRNEILIPTKLITYSAVGYCTCVLAPMLFEYVGLTYTQ
eukprot:m.24959 g.24959  ORF g.24959 m.24959 type:complete len:477 (+) comp5714_c0_seq1:46-1476(+)